MSCVVSMTSRKNYKQVQSGDADPMLPRGRKIDIVTTPLIEGLKEAMFLSSGFPAKQSANFIIIKETKEIVKKRKQHSKANP
ncbi:hypothetical protein BTUL_0201g00220 [Botrytis tulipae]|uniref:Uncharacterized protein n=1 Tax=Botrytis tulipae TaxID=87230 RepID=A0A4Z1EHG0_9HELO|nr:hypothetical protein BTUL_0201g00220 [Botrytis tulipae]